MLSRALEISGDVSHVHKKSSGLVQQDIYDILYTAEILTSTYLNFTLATAIIRLSQ